MSEQAFRFDYDAGVIRHGSGCVADLDTELATLDCERALVVCGQTVGSTPAVVDPVRDGLGDRLAGVFAETTPEKRLDTAISGVEAMERVDADAIVAVGGGSSLDVAKAMAVVAARDDDPKTLGDEIAAGLLAVPDSELPPVVAVPTTLAGADLSMLAGITATPESGLVAEPASGGLWDRRLMPAALFYDPDLVATTPREILAASAMNGFDKGIETLYARTATPVTDATATRGLSILADALPTLGESQASWETARILRGIVLVQYGISRPDATTLSLVHAFGHGLREHGDVQQGVAHAVVAPPALAYLFDHVDGRRELLADAFGIETDGRSEDAIATDVVAAVREVRDALGLPRRLRDVDGVDRSMLDAIAEHTVSDSLLANAPADLDLTVADARGILDDAW